MDVLVDRIIRNASCHDCWLETYNYPASQPALARIKDGKDKFYPHTLNGSALAVGRTLLAIIENFYENGLGVRIPKVLANYLDFDLIEEQK